MKNNEITALIYDARGNGDGGVSPTLTGDHQNRITDYTAILLEIHEEDTDDSQRPRGGIIQWDTKDISPTLRSQMNHHEPIVVLQDDDEDGDREEVL